MNRIVILLQKVLERNIEDKKARMSGIENLKKKIGEEEMEMIKDAQERLDRVWNYAMDILGVLLRNLPELTSTAIKPNLLPLFAGNLASHETKESYEIVDAICLIDDCMEFGPKSFFDEIAPMALPLFIEVLYKRGVEHTGLTQSAAYGMGVIAQKTAPSESFKESL